MRPLRLAVLASLLSAAVPAAAQLRNHSVSVESGLSSPLAGRGGARPTYALAATAWLDGSLEAVARVAVASGAETAGRGAARGMLAGTAGLRISLLPDPLRPQLGVELGWARLEGAEGTTDRLALGAVAGLEWFPARDVSVAARAALRGAASAMSAELLVGLAAYF
jgi:hypothetical protein